MKIDMLSIQANYKCSNEGKSGEKEIEFLSVLDTNIDENNNTEAIKEEVDIEEKLLELISLIFNNNKVNVNENLKLEEIKNVPEEIGLKDINSLKELFNNGELEKSLKELNISSEEDKLIKKALENITKEEVNIYEKAINLLDEREVNLDTDKDKIIQYIKKLQGTDKEYIRIDNNENYNEFISKDKDNGDFTFNKYKENLFFEVNNSKLNKSFNNESIDDNELNILNNIAFSNNNVENNIKDTAIPIVRQQNISEDMFNAIKYLNNNNIEELNVKMNPKDLGNINIKFLKTESENKFIITLTKEDTFNLINKNIDEIKSHLNNLDMNVKEIVVEIKSGNENDFSHNLNQQFNRDNSKEEKKNNFIKKQELNEEDNLNLEDTNINLLI